jgi:hypothetical protein
MLGAIGNSHQKAMDKSKKRKNSQKSEGRKTAKHHHRKEIDVRYAPERSERS